MGPATDLPPHGRRKAPRSVSVPDQSPERHARRDQIQIENRATSAGAHKHREPILSTFANNVKVIERKMFREFICLDNPESTLRMKPVLETSNPALDDRL
jgi:hypothetical protein